MKHSTFTWHLSTFLKGYILCHLQLFHTFFFSSCNTKKLVNIFGTYAVVCNIYFSHLIRQSSYLKTCWTKFTILKLVDKRFRYFMPKIFIKLHYFSRANFIPRVTSWPALVLQTPWWIFKLVKQNETPACRLNHNNTMMSIDLICCFKMPMNFHLHRHQPNHTWMNLKKSNLNHQTHSHINTTWNRYCGHGKHH